MRLHLVDVVSDGRQHGLNRLRRQLRALSLAQQQLGAMGVDFWRAALVIPDMGVALADDARVGWPERRPRPRVARRPRRPPYRPDAPLGPITTTVDQSDTPRPTSQARIETARFPR